MFKKNSRIAIYLGIIAALIVVSVIYIVRAQNGGEDGKIKDAAEKTNNTAKAKVVVQEYSDYQCPYCATAHFVLRDVKEKLGDAVTIEFINFPLVELHPIAKDVAIAAECARKQNKFEAFQDYVFSRQGYLSASENLEEVLIKGAKEVGGDLEQFTKCYQKKETKEIVEKDIKRAENLKLSGTPTIFVNDEKIDFNSWKELSEIIEKKARE